LLIASELDQAEKIVKAIRREEITAEIIGEFLNQPQKREIIRKNGKTEKLVRPTSDHLWQALEKP
jgi:hydrogenase maturation factor